MSKYFRQFPYPGWIILFFVFLIATFWGYNMEKKQLSFNHLAQKVQSDFNKREAVVYVDAKTGFFKKQYQDTLDLVKPQDYEWIILDRNEQVSWNNNNIALSDFITNNPDSFLNGSTVHLNYKTYFLKSYQLSDLDSVYALTFIPILYKFAFESKYFTSHFVADNRIPTSTVISDTLLPSAIPILSNSKKEAFYIQFKEDPSKTYSSGFLVWMFTIACFFCLFIIIHKFCIEITKRQKGYLAFFFLIGFISFFTLFLYYIGLPPGMKNAAIFSPSLLSSDRFVISFGSLTYMALCDTWILLFVLMYMEIPKIGKFKNRLLGIFSRLLLVAALVFILYFIQADRIYKLIIDSKISFEVSDFSKLNIYTFLGLVVLSIITINFIFILQIIKTLLQGVLNNNRMQCLYVGLLSILCILLLYESDLLLFYFIILFMSIAGMALLHNFGLPLSLFSGTRKLTQTSYTYIWFVILCTWISIVVFYFNFSKEREIRKVFAGKKEQRDDVDVKFAFEDLSQDIQGNEMLRRYLKNANSISKLEIDRQLNYNFINGVFNKFQVYFYYYDKNKKSLLGQDTLDAAILRAVNIEMQNTNFNSIAYINDLDGKSLYWGMTPVLSANDKPNLSDTLGYVGFNFTMVVLLLIEC